MAVGVERGALNLTRAAEYLGVPRRWLRDQGVRKFKIPYLRPPGSKQILFLPSDLDRVLESWRANDKVGSPPREHKQQTPKRAPKKAAK